MFKLAPPIYVVCVAPLWVLKKREKKRQYFLLSLVSTICLDQENGDCAAKVGATREMCPSQGHRKL